MAAKTKIFISSSAQDALKDLREETFKIIAELGHEPLMFEKNDFGPWHDYDKDATEHCLAMVENSNIFILFISNKSGTYLKEEGRTLTHLEFLKAYQGRKTMIVFVEKRIIGIYFSKVKTHLTVMVNEFCVKHGILPQANDLLSMLEAISNELPPKDDVEYYTWVFLHDIVEKKIYCEYLTLGVGHREQITNYLSNMLARGSDLLPFVATIEQNVRRIRTYEDFDDLVNVLISDIEVKQVKDWRIFLTTLREKMVGGEILEGTGKYIKRELGLVRNCSAISLYRREGDFLNLVERDGRAGGKAQYKLDDNSSYVAVTFQKNSECLFYREDKQMLYLVSRVADFVISFHFPCDENLAKQDLRYFQDGVLDAILKLGGNALNLNLVKLILEELKNA